MQQAQNEQHTRPAITPETLPAYPGPADLQKLLDVSEAGLNSLLKAGVIPAPVVKSGRIRRWNRDAVLAVLNGSAS